MHPGTALRIARGYRPGVIGRISEMHASFYSRHAGFGQFFESRVAAGLAEFSDRLGSPRNGLWTALDEERIVGAIAVDGEDIGDNTAHVRWFIMDDSHRGLGVGRRLLDEAVRFCDEQGFASTVLWTFKSLDAARKLYEEAGFVLEREEEGRQWGKSVIEQYLVRPLPGKDLCGKSKHPA